MTNVIINTDKLNNDARKLKAKQVEKEMNFVINSAYFKGHFLNYVGKVKNSEADWSSKTIEEIFEHFMAGPELLNNVKDYIIDIEIDDYYKGRSSVIAYTYSSIKTIYVNTKFYDYSTTKECGSNLCHESAHKLGFGEPICYAINTAYELTWNLLFSSSQEEPNDRPIVCKRTWRTLWLKKVCYFV